MGRSKTNWEESSESLSILLSLPQQRSQVDTVTPDMGQGKQGRGPVGPGRAVLRFTTNTNGPKLFYKLLENARATTCLSFLKPKQVM